MKKIHLLILAAFFSFISYSIYNSFSDCKLIEKDGEMTTGKIVDFKHTQKSSYTFYYTYEVNGKTYKSNKSCSYFECDSNNSGCKGIEFPVVYSKSRPEVSDIDLKSNNRYKRTFCY